MVDCWGNLGYDKVKGEENKVVERERERERRVYDSGVYVVRTAHLYGTDETLKFKL